jgi:hypothetical protein
VFAVRPVYVMYRPADVVLAAAATVTTGPLVAPTAAYVYEAVVPPQAQVAVPNPDDPDTPVPVNKEVALGAVAPDANTPHRADSVVEVATWIVTTVVSSDVAETALTAAEEATAEELVGTVADVAAADLTVAEVS